MKKKICIVGTNMMNIYNHRLELIKKLLSLSFDVFVVAPRGGEERKLEEMGVHFIDTPVDNRGTSIKNDLGLLRNLVRIFKKEKFDVVLTFYTKTNIYAGLACRKTKTPYIANITGLGTAVANGGLMGRIMLILYSRAVKKASMIFFQNQQNREFFKDHKIRPEIGRMLPGSGVDLNRYHPLDYPVNDSCEFLFVSRILREKGIEEYVEAARLIKGKNPATKFHVVGPCEESHKQFIEQAEKEGVIVYHGKQFDIHPFLERCHCTVFPSYYAEGMANVLLESAASARPIITTSLPGCGETVEDGKTGFVVEARNADSLAQAMMKFIGLDSEAKKKMGLNGRRKMEREFNRKIVTDAYIEEIQNIIERKLK